MRITLTKMASAGVLAVGLASSASAIVQVPEIDAGTLGSAVTVVVAGLLILADRVRRS